MKWTICLALALGITACGNNKQKEETKEPMKTTTADSTSFKSGHSQVNGIDMYYEIHGQGDTLVLIHGGGSTIQSSFGRMIPLLARTYTVVAMELQNHGRSGFRDVPQTFEQDADDVANLLANLGIRKAHFLGFSNGGQTAMLTGIRHPDIVDRLVVISAAYNRNGFPTGFFEGMQQARLEHMPPQLKTAFLEVTPDSAKLQAMFEKDRDRMLAFEGWSDELIRSIAAPTLIIGNDADVVAPEHTLALHRLIPNSRLAIMPGVHGESIGEITTLGSGSQNMNATVLLVRDFLDNHAR